MQLKAKDFGVFRSAALLDLEPNGDRGPSLVIFASSTVLEQDSTEAHF